VRKWEGEREREVGGTVTGWCHDKFALQTRNGGG
jgi:hypothetical protein